MFVLQLLQTFGLLFLLCHVGGELGDPLLEELLLLKLELNVAAFMPEYFAETLQTLERTLFSLPFWSSSTMMSSSSFFSLASVVTFSI